MKVKQIIGIVALVSISKILIDQVQKNPVNKTAEQNAQHMAKVMQPFIPMSSDGITITNVIADGRFLRINKVMMYSSNEVTTDPSEVAAIAVEQFNADKARMCGTPDTRKYIDSGVDIIIEYTTSDKVHFTNVLVENCDA
jgi:hypothetical protein